MGRCDKQWTALFDPARSSVVELLATFVK